MGLDTKTDWPTDRRSSRNYDTGLVSWESVIGTVVAIDARSWSNELAVRQSAAGKDVNTETGGICIVGSRNLATASEDSLRRLSVCCSENSSAWISDVRSTCNYE
jgi:hypothetical protein